MSLRNLLADVERIYRAAKLSEDGHRCMVAPHPEAQQRLMNEIRAMASERSALARLPSMLRIAQPGEAARLGFNDGLVIPPSYFSPSASPHAIRSAAAQRAPIHGILRVAVILVDFSDQPFDAANDVAHFEQLFFSQGQIETGSVREYFHEVTHGLVDIQGEVCGPFRLGRTLVQYAHGDSGTGDVRPNARTMARDAALAADPQINFSTYDNDQDGFVDAFVVVHAGPGAEVTLNPNHIWSHKWVLEDGALTIDGTRIFAYLTVPEDARIGVCCHELGHLLFGFPDLYDADGSSNGVGNWCLMGGGSWGGNGLRPVHPSAWCKANQAWVTVDNVVSTSTLTIPDVKTSNKVHRLWRNGSVNPEYFLIENRQRTGFDGELPGDGLLVWHIDDNVSTNTNEARYKVALVQADGAKALEKHPSQGNRGDAGDPYPGSSNNRTLNNTSTPNTRAYSGQSSQVSITEISSNGTTMSARVSVSGVSPLGPGGAIPPDGTPVVTLPQLVRRVEALERIVMVVDMDADREGEPLQPSETVGDGSVYP
jgi:immune inhibitor A